MQLPGDRTSLFLNYHGVYLIAVPSELLLGNLNYMTPMS